MWRGDLSPLGCAASLNRPARCLRQTAMDVITTAAQPDGDKSPRHRSPPYRSDRYFHRWRL
ncbi:hypothetical protein EVS84_18030 [Pseudomonas koreensis]|uniref:Uncharacterized protein n=1 Tax=Pseudomonas koreensis TaxID=198620 RepID=A0A4Q4L568_9PSED|nr:hypothetical protein EVS84_18030 [Pseudomonas koreensis]